MISEIETVWYLVEEADIEKMAQMIMGEQFGSVCICIKTPKRVTITVFAEKKNIIRLKRQFFVLPRVEKPNLKLFFLGTHSSRLRKIYEPEGAMAPCIGLFDPIKRVGLLAGLRSFGLLCSAILGLVSTAFIPLGYFPAHAGLLALNEKGVILSGGHGVGKTTSIFEIVSRSFQDGVVSVLSDDWALFQLVNSDLIGTTVISSIALNKNICEDFGSPYLSDLLANNNLPGTNTVYLKPDVVFPETKLLRKIIVKKVFILAAGFSDTWCKKIASRYCAKLIVDAAYHMPNVGHLEKLQLNFWTKALLNVESYLLDTRCRAISRNELFDKFVQLIK